MSNNNNNKQCQEHFKLFSYFAMAIVTIAIMVGLFIILQHISEEEKTETTIANQETLLENQQYLKNITTELRTHEFEEMHVLKERSDISTNNSKKLDQILELLGRPR